MTPETLKVECIGGPACGDTVDVKFETDGFWLTVPTRIVKSNYVYEYDDARDAYICKGVM